MEILEVAFRIANRESRDTFAGKALGRGGLWKKVKGHGDIAIGIGVPLFTRSNGLLGRSGTETVIIVQTEVLI